MPTLPLLSTPSQRENPSGDGNRADAAHPDVADRLRGLTAAVEGEVRLGRHDRMLYATDASLYQVEPLAVVIPSSVEDAVRATRYCAEHGLPMLPRGGGTSLAGQCTSEAVVIDTSSRCLGIEQVDVEGRRCRAEAGVTIEDLNDHLFATGTGLFFAPDPSTSRHAAIGGCIGNNAAGARSVRYGRTSESVLGIDACLADGTRVLFEKGAALRDARVADLTERIVGVVRRYERLIRERFPKTKRRNAGYGLDMILAQLDDHGGDIAGVNLAMLLAGSEGTLATTLAADLVLHPAPRSKGLAVLSFATVDDAIAAVPPILETGPTAVELLDDLVIGLAKDNRECRRYVELMPKPSSGELNAVLYVEYFADGLERDAEGEIAEKFGLLRSMFPGADIAAHTNPGAMRDAWALRKAGEPLLHAIPGTRKPLGFVEDNAIPVERLGEFVRRFREAIEREGTRAAFWAHASVGVLHVRPLLDLRDPEDEARMHRIALAGAHIARDLGGVMSGEHGDGKARGPLLEDFYGPELMGAFREVKAIFDPRGLLNPGNIVSPGPIESISERVRIRPGETPVGIDPAIDTFYRYEDQHGFAGAVEMCNGAGVCRKKTGGTMCPSYMGTLDERHSTRGRGNALRLAISGQLGLTDRAGAPAARWDDPETIGTLDLCLSCKACKAECPSNVDIARLKAEYTAQRYRVHGTPLKSKFFGAVRELNRLGSMTPRLANWVNRLGPVRGVIDRVLGLAPGRSLPPFSTPLPRALKRRRKVQIAKAAPEVLLFGDCFSMFNESGIGVAAFEVLESLGYRVRVLADGAHGCCGRPKMSTGLLPEAIDEISGTLEHVLPELERPGVTAMLFLEPSCLSAAVDDWLSLKLGVSQDKLQMVADRSMLVEEFVAQHWDEHPSKPRFRPDDRPVVLHGHCHQKALRGTASTEAMLRRIAGDGFRALDSGCCGMAGSFGYTRDRFELSNRIGERVVLPEARATEAKGGVMVAPGTSCRHQMHDGARVRALHPVEYLRSRL
ncbi:MAG: FAD-linked oxidase C-terminal domain-containing protein [Planctomycetota bacterium]